LSYTHQVYRYSIFRFVFLMRRRDVLRRRARQESNLRPSA
jgi:hypothetical protein